MSEPPKNPHIRWEGPLLRVAWDASTDTNVSGYKVNVRSSTDSKPLDDPTKVWGSWVSAGRDVEGRATTITLLPGIDTGKDWQVRVRSLTGTAPGPTVAIARVPVEPPPPPPPTGFKRGVCAGGWARAQEVKDLLRFPDPIVRLENPTDTRSFTDAGVDVIYLDSGGTTVNVPHLSPEGRELRQHVQEGKWLLPTVLHEKYGYSSGGVRSLNASTVAANAVAILRKHPAVLCYELLNEPGGNWFWGSGAESQENAAAYAKLVRAVHTALRAAGFRQPILVSFDGGHAGDNTWGKRLLAADPTLFQLDGVIPTNHPYDGSGASPSATLVRWGSVEETHRVTGLWPFISEYGRPLLTSTGDSPRSTEAQQAAADGAMAAKCREVGCPGYTAYGYKGDNSPCYAVFQGNGTPRAAVAAIVNA